MRKKDYLFFGFKSINGNHNISFDVNISVDISEPYFSQINDAFKDFKNKIKEIYENIKKYDMESK